MDFLGLVRQSFLTFLQCIEHTEIRAEVIDLDDFHAVTRVVGEYLTFGRIDQTARFAGRAQASSSGRLCGIGGICLALTASRSLLSISA